MNVESGSTDVTTYFKLRLASDGTAATGLTITDLDLQYVRSGATPAAKVDATALAATDTAHTDNYAIEIDATDQPGLYRVDWPDAAFAAGVREVILTVKHTSIFTEDMRVNLTPVPANMTQVSGDSAAADYLEALKDNAITGTADSGTTTTMVDAARTEADDFWNGQLLVFTSGNNAGLARVITDFTASSDTVTFSPALPNAVAAADAYEIAPAGQLLNALFAEPTGVPGATISLAEKISWLYMALRNKVTVTATKKTFFDDGDAAEWEKDVSDDGTTYTETEANSI